MNLSCALCLHLLAGGRGLPVGPAQRAELADVITVVNGHASCHRHYPYLRWPRDLDESAQVALGDGIGP